MPHTPPPRCNTRVRVDSTYLYYIPGVKQFNPTQAIPGIGSTPEAAIESAIYTGIPAWAHALGIVTTLNKNKAKAGVLRAALRALQVPCAVCGGPRHLPACADAKTGVVFPVFARRALEWHQEGCPPTLENGLRVALPRLLKKQQSAPRQAHTAASTEASTTS